MRIVTALALTLMAASPALAQTASPAPAAAPAAAPAFSADTPLETVVANPAAKAVLDKDLPSISTHPAFDQFKAMSLRQLQPYAQGKITDEAIAKVDADLKAVPGK
jgi:hypothetical protein